MFGLMALITVILPWVMLLLMAVLIWQQRRRWLRALLALVALGLMWLSNSREILYAIGLPLPYPGEPGGALRDLVGALEGYAWQILALATLAAAALALPLPAPRGQRVLAVIVVLGLGVSAALVWSFKSLRFI